ncbi:MAG: OmpA family protein [Paracoccaceae bacterium]
MFLIVNRSLSIRASLLALALCMGEGAGADETPMSALVLSMPAPATETARQTDAFGSYRLPEASWDGQALPVLHLEGRVAQTSWRLDSGATETLTIFAALRDQIVAQGYVLLMECETIDCGGFDFRYGLTLLPEPEMHVDLGDFRFLSARREKGSSVSHLGLMVSRSREAGYVQITTVAPAEGRAPLRPQPVQTPVVEGVDAVQARNVIEVPTAPQNADLATALDRDGFAVMDDLRFESGQSELAEGDYPSLAGLADFLVTRPGVLVSLVGHTDASGGLAENTRLSKARAESVRKRLIAEFDVPPDRIAAHGVGYLAPRISNQSPEGRAQNRRVEVIVTSTP